MKSYRLIDLAMTRSFNLSYKDTQWRDTRSTSFHLVEETLKKKQNYLACLYGPPEKKNMIANKRALLRHEIFCSCIFCFKKPNPSLIHNLIEEDLTQIESYKNLVSFGHSCQVPHSLVGMTK